MYSERALSMTWTRGRRQLLVRASYHSNSAVFEQAIWHIAKDQRASDRSSAACSTGDNQPRTLGTLARPTAATATVVWRSATTLIVHLSDEPRPARRRGTDQHRDRRVADLRRTRLAIPPGHPTSSTHTSDAAPPAPSTAPSTNAPAELPIPRLHRPPRTRSPPPIAGERCGKPNSPTSSSSAPATTNSSTTTTSTPPATPNDPASQTPADAPSPPTSHTHHPADRPISSRSASARSPTGCRRGPGR